MKPNPYKILKVDLNASLEEIKKSYRQLVKIHHPDKGGDTKVMLEINEAWATLKKKHKNLNFNNQDKDHHSYNYSKINYKKENNNSSKSKDVKDWFQKIYLPIDKLLGQVINPLSSKIRELSADPYDQLLMESFCEYIEKSKNKIEKVKKIYISKASPLIVKQFSLDLYHCLSQVDDGLNELERYTLGYVDDYLHDGKAMLVEAKKRRKLLQNNKKEWLIL